VQESFIFAPRLADVSFTLISSGEKRHVTFTIYYTEGLEGYYEATLSQGGTDMVSGTARANKGDATVTWTAKRISQ
jgi:hypothetical protein